jgi:hypothetical protein
MRFPAGLCVATVLILTASACQPNAPFREQTAACTANAKDNGSSCAKALRDAIDETSWPHHQDQRSTRLVTIGHSFGGLIVYTALSQYFLDRAVQTGMADYARSLGQDVLTDAKSRTKEIAG